MDEPVRAIDLSKAPGEREAWDRPSWVFYLWALCELVFVTNPFQVSSGLRVRVLRLFGADIGDGVIMRPRLRVKFPWKLSVGARSWIGESVWIHNQDRMQIGRDVVVSQESFLTTGTHAFRRDMALDVPRGHRGRRLDHLSVHGAGSLIGRSVLTVPNALVRGEAQPARSSHTLGACRR